jgi:restriction endonuclease S subunit
VFEHEIAMRMNNEIEQLKISLKDMREIILPFPSEAVQIRIIDRLLPLLALSDRNPDKPPYDRKTGATGILKIMLSTDYFKEPRTIAGISGYIFDHYGLEIATTKLSGILLALTRSNTLKRIAGESDNLYRYSIAG